MQIKTSVVSLLLMLFAVTAGAAPVYHGYLQTAEELFVPDNIMDFGLESEMVFPGKLKPGQPTNTVANRNLNKAAQLTLSQIGGTFSQPNYKTTRMDNNSVGKWLEVKLEINETSDDPTIDWLALNPNPAIEVVSSPIKYSQAVVYGKLVNYLGKNGGAKGTYEFDKSGRIVAINPVSFQVNVGITEGTNKEKVDDLMVIVRNFFNPNHQVQIFQTYDVPERRMPYLRDYSPGMMTKIADSSYHPEPYELFFDFFYRQSLENYIKEDNAKNHLNNDTQAPWKMSAAAVRIRIEALGYPVFEEIIKLNQLKIASLLMNLFPNDKYTIAVLKQGWIKADPCIEFRLANLDTEDLDPIRVVKQVGGLIQLSRKYGVYDNDVLVSKLKGIPLETLRQIRAEEAPKLPTKRISCDAMLGAS